LEGGAQVSVLSIGKALASKRMAEVYYCFPKDDEYCSVIDEHFIREVRTSTKRFVVPYRKLFEFKRLTNQVQTIVTEVEPDIVHSQMPASLLINGAIKTRKGLIRCHTDRGLYTGYRFPMRFLSVQALKKVDALITTTKLNASYWQEHTKKRIQVIPNMISEEFGPFDPSVRERFRLEYGTKDSLVLGFAGRMTEVKNWPLALEIVKNLRQRTRHFFVAVAMGVYKSSTREKQQAIEFVKNLSSIVGDRLIYKENASPREMSDFYYLVDIFILTSRFESFGRTAIEAMSRKCCVLGTNVGGIPEVIDDPDLICPQDSECFTNSVLSLTRDKELLESKQESLFRRFNETFSSRATISRQYELYLSLLEERR